MQNTPYQAIHDNWAEERGSLINALRNSVFDKESYDHLVASLTFLKDNMEAHHLETILIANRICNYLLLLFIAHFDPRDSYEAAGLSEYEEIASEIYSLGTEIMENALHMLSGRT